MTTVNLNLIPVDDTQLVLAAGDDTQLVLSAGDETQIVLSSVAISNGLMMTDGSNSALALGSAGTPSLKFAGDANTGIFSPGADQLSVTTGGTERLRIDGAGQIEAVSLGSAAAPTFSFTGDPNTGVYSPGADQLAISTAGTGRLFVDASGRVGIGVTPTTTLDVAGPIRSLSGTIDARLQAGYSGAVGIGAQSNDAVLFIQNATERLRITSAGLVGIGTSSPSSTLTVNGTCRIEQASSFAGINIKNNNDSSLSTTTSYLDATNNLNTVDGHIFFEHLTTGGSNFTVGTTPAGDRATDRRVTRLIVTSTGNVGIGTSSPGTLLDTRGFASYRGNAYAIASFCGNNTLAPLNIVQSTNGTAPGISAGQNSSGAFQPLVLLTSEVVRQTISTVGTTTLNCNSATSPLQVQINSSEVARIDSSGRLLIGTSTARSNFFGTTLSAVTQTEGTGGAAGRGSLSVINNDVSNNPPYVLLGRSGAATLGSNAAVVSGSRLGTLTFHGADGTNFVEAATVAGEVDGTPGTNDMPGRLVFSTTADGAASPTERMRITSAGLVGIGTGSPYSKLTVLPTSTPSTPATANQITIGEATANTGYRLQLGYLFDTGGRGSIQAYDNNSAATLILNGAGGNVGIGTTSPGGRLQINIQDGFLFDVGAGAYTYMRFGSQSTAEGVAELAFDRAAGAVALKTGNTGSTLNTRLSIDAAGATIINNQNGTERARIDSSGRLGIGTTNPAAILHAVSADNATTGLISGATNAIRLVGNNTGIGGGAIEGVNAAASAFVPLLVGGSDLRLAISGTERARIDSNGRLLVGTSSARANYYSSVTPGGIQSEAGTQSLFQNSNNATGSAFYLGKSRGATVNSNTVVQADDQLGALVFFGADGTNVWPGAQITAAVDGTPGANDMPGRLVFSTTADGAASPTERMRITSAGLVGIGTVSPGLQLDVSGAGGQAIRAITTDTSGTNIGRLIAEFTGGGGGVQSSVDLRAGNGYSYLVNSTNTPLLFGTNAIERARFDASGGFRVKGAGTAGVNDAFFINGSAPANSFQLDSAGRVGIGTTSPAYALDVQVGDARFKRSASDDAAIYFGSTTNNYIFGSNTGNLFVFATNGTERARIDSSGRLGLGTSNPIENFHVQSGDERKALFTNTDFVNTTTGTSLDVAFGATTGNTFVHLRALNSGRSAWGNLILQGGGGRVGIGTTAPENSLHVLGTVQINTGAVADGLLIRRQYNNPIDLRLRTYDDSTKDFIFRNDNGTLRFIRNATEVAQLDSSGRLLVGTSSARSNFYNLTNITPFVQYEGANSNSLRSTSQVYGSADNAGPYHVLAKHRGTTTGLYTVVAANDELGVIDFQGADGAEFVSGVRITAEVDGTPGTNDMPGRLVFSTTADGAASPTERMRIKSTGIVNIANTPTYADNAAATAGGLVAGDIYRTSTGQLMIRY